QKQTFCGVNGMSGSPSGHSAAGDGRPLRATCGRRLGKNFLTLLQVAVWLEGGRKMNPPDDLARSRGEVPIEVFAAEQLRRRLRKVRKRGKQLAQLDANKRHKLRIQVKKLRYAAEFFSGLFQNKKAMRRQKKFMPALERLQDGLGDLNDIAVDERLIASAAAPKRAFAAGLLTGHEEARENEALSNAIDGYTKLVKAKSFWR